MKNANTDVLVLANVFLFHIWNLFTVLGDF